MTPKSHWGDWFGWVSSPNWQLSLCKRPQRPSLFYSVSLWLADRNNFLSLVVCLWGLQTASQLSHMKCPIKRYKAGWVGTPVSSQMFARLTVCLCYCVFSLVFISSLFWQRHRALVCVLFMPASIHPSTHLSIYPSIYSSLLFNEMASHIKVHWLCAHKPRFN